MSNENEIATSDFNLTIIDTEKLERLMDSTIACGSNLLVVGRRGTGKTDICEQRISAADLDMVYINLSVFDRTDLAGFPNVLDPNAQFIKFILPYFFKNLMTSADVTTSPKKKVVVVFDECDKVPEDVQGPLLEFVQKRKINGIPLDNIQAIFMTGNLLSEGGHRPIPPLLDRCMAFMVEANYSNFENWNGKTHAVHPVVMAFLSKNPSSLFGAVDPDDRYKDPSPRGWTLASKDIYHLEKLSENGSVDKEIINHIVSGYVGKKAGIDFKIYYDHYHKLIPMINDIKSGKISKEAVSGLEPVEKLICAFMVLANVSTDLDKLTSKDCISTKTKTSVTETWNLPAWHSHAANFMMMLDAEYIMVAVRSQITFQRIMKYKLSEYAPWDKVLSFVKATQEGFGA